MAVASTNKSDVRASSSNYGSWVDVSAPGVDVLSTLPGGYGYMSGTSMATPHLTALAGLLAAEGYGPTGVKTRIRRTALDLGLGGFDPYYGYGRIDADRAESGSSGPKSQARTTLVGTMNRRRG